MSEHPDLSFEERAILHLALSRPLQDSDPTIIAICQRLCARGLLQRAGGISVVNGWHGSPHAFVLTRDGWAVSTGQRRPAAVRRTG